VLFLIDCVGHHRLFAVGQYGPTLWACGGKPSLALSGAIAMSSTAIVENAG
jgi:hypothetical protein